jgi:NADH dehydrogenase FAD-containing subunit
VEAGQNILPRTTDKARALAMAFLKERHVEVILGEMVHGAPPPNDVAAEKGEAVTDKGSGSPTTWRYGAWARSRTLST